jgi:hypothetical protein
MIWKAALGLGWVPFVVAHAIWAWYTSGDLTTYWMICVCALSLAYAIQWITANMPQTDPSAPAPTQSEK